MMENQFKKRPVHFVLMRSIVIFCLFFLNNDQIVFTFISLLPEAEPYSNSSECISYVALPALTQLAVVWGSVQIWIQKLGFDACQMMLSFSDILSHLFLYTFCPAPILVIIILRGK